MLVLSTNTNPGTASWSPLPSSGMSYVELNPNTDIVSATAPGLELPFANTVTIPPGTFTSALGYFDFICRFNVINSDVVPVVFSVGVSIGGGVTPTAALTKDGFTVQAGDTVTVNFPPIRVLQFGTPPSIWSGMGIVSLANPNFAPPIVPQVQQIAPSASGIDYAQPIVLTPVVSFGSIAAVDVICLQVQVVAVQP
jgi:hypothetical protein